MPHHVFERDFRAPLAFEVTDAVYRHERPRDVPRDRVEDLQLPAEALGPGRALHVQDPDDLFAGAERHDHGLTGLRVAPTEPVVIDRTQQNHLFSAAGHPAGDALVDALLVPERHADPHGRPNAEPVALDEHDRCPAGAHPRGDVLGRACQEC